MRFALEFQKVDLCLRDARIASTLTVFGSARIPAPDRAPALIEAARASGDPRRLAVAERLAGLAAHYDMARAFGRIASERGGARRPYGPRDNVVMTGGGPGIMEAANRGAADAGAPSIGLGITLPHETANNPFVTPELSFRLHYFAIRKFLLVMRTNALVVFPGGLGSLDELFEVLTLSQTGKGHAFQVVLCGREFWRRTFDLAHLADHGLIDDADLERVRWADSAEEAWETLVAGGLPLER